jgi:hypothetical protein
MLKSLRERAVGEMFFAFPFRLVSAIVRALRLLRGSVSIRLSPLWY